MGVRQYVRVYIAVFMYIHLTAFGPFGSVSDNPSSRLVQSLQQEAGALVADTAVLDVSAKAATEYIQRSFVDARDCADKEHCWIHLGVDGNADCFKLEEVAANEARFRIPDVTGW